jgi:hypothetical protein
MARKSSVDFLDEDGNAPHGGPGAAARAWFNMPTFAPQPQPYEPNAIRPAPDFTTPGAFAAGQPTAGPAAKAFLGGTSANINTLAARLGINNSIDITKAAEPATAPVSKQPPPIDITKATMPTDAPVTKGSFLASVAPAPAAAPDARVNTITDASGIVRTATPAAPEQYAQGTGGVQVGNQYIRIANPQRAPQSAVAAADFLYNPVSGAVSGDNPASGTTTAAARAKARQGAAESAAPAPSTPLERAAQGIIDKTVDTGQIPAGDMLQRAAKIRPTPLAVFDQLGAMRGIDRPEGSPATAIYGEPPATGNVTRLPDLGQVPIGTADTLNKELNAEIHANATGQVQTYTDSQGNQRQRQPSVEAPGALTYAGPDGKPVPLPKSDPAYQQFNQQVAPLQKQLHDIATQMRNYRDPERFGKMTTEDRQKELEKLAAKAGPLAQQMQELAAQHSAKAAARYKDSIGDPASDAQIRGFEQTGRFHEADQVRRDLLQKLDTANLDLPPAVAAKIDDLKRGTDPALGGRMDVRMAVNQANNLMRKFGPPYRAQIEAEQLTASLSETARYAGDDEVGRQAFHDIYAKIAANKEIMNQLYRAKRTGQLDRVGAAVLSIKAGTSEDVVRKSLREDLAKQDADRAVKEKAVDGKLAKDEETQKAKEAKDAETAKAKAEAAAEHLGELKATMDADAKVFAAADAEFKKAGSSAGSPAEESKNKAWTAAVHSEAQYKEAAAARNQTPAAGGQQPAAGKAVDEARAAQFLNQAGGDKAKARELAKAAGYTF